MEMTEIAPLWGIKVTVDAVANGFIVSCVSHGNSEIASMGNCISPTLDEALLTAIAYYNAYLPDGLKMVAPAPFPLDPCPECGGYPSLDLSAHYPDRLIAMLQTIADDLAEWRRLAEQRRLND